MKKYIMLIMVLALISIPCVAAQAASPRISPYWTVMVESPYTFDVWAQNADVYDCQVLLVVTQECYNALTSVTLNGIASDTVYQGEFTAVTLNSASVPTGATATYQVAALKDHLDYGLGYDLEAGDTIYWALSDSLFDPLTGDTESLEVTVASSDPSLTRMTIYLIGNTENDSGDLDTRTPPTNPGFMIPEVAIGSVMAVASMFTALGLYTYKKKQKAKQ